MDVLKPLLEAGYTIGRVDEEKEKVVCDSPESIAAFADEFYREVNVVARL